MLMATRRNPISRDLRNLKPSTKYGVKVQALTAKGAGPAATAPLCSTLEEGELKKKLCGLDRETG